MNWILLYCLCIASLVTVLSCGYYFNVLAKKQITPYLEKENSKGLLVKEFAYLMFNHYKLRNIDITTLHAKKTNFYSIKYNVIKLSPEVTHSKTLTDIALCTKCITQAKNQQYHYLISTLNLIFSVISKFITILLIPIILICAILNISFELSSFSYILTLITLICYVSIFIIQLIIHFIKQNSIKKTYNSLKKLETFNENEITSIINILVALNNQDFFLYTRYTLKFISLASPTTFFDKKQF